MITTVHNPQQNILEVCITGKFQLFFSTPVRFILCPCGSSELEKDGSLPHVFSPHPQTQQNLVRDQPGVCVTSSRLIGP